MIFKVIFFYFWDKTSAFKEEFKANLKLKHFTLQMLLNILLKVSNILSKAHENHPTNLTFYPYASFWIYLNNSTCSGVLEQTTKFIVFIDIQITDFNFSYIRKDFCLSWRFGKVVPFFIDSSALDLNLLVFAVILQYTSLIGM